MRRVTQEVFKRAATRPRRSGQALLDRSGHGRFGTLPTSKVSRRAKTRPNGDAETFATAYYGMKLGIGTWQVPATVNHLMVFVQNSGT